MRKRISPTCRFRAGIGVSVPSDRLSFSCLFPARRCKSLFSSHICVLVAFFFVFCPLAERCFSPSLRYAFFSLLSHQRSSAEYGWWFGSGSASSLYRLTIFYGGFRKHSPKPPEQCYSSSGVLLRRPWSIATAAPEKPYGPSAKRPEGPRGMA